MKTVANAASLQEAQSLKLTLGSAGIEAFIPDEISAGVLPPMSMMKSGVRVQVDEKDVEEAKAIIAHGFDHIGPPPLPDEPLE